MSLFPAKERCASFLHTLMENLVPITLAHHPHHHHFFHLPGRSQLLYLSHLAKSHFCCLTHWHSTHVPAPVACLFPLALVINPKQALSCNTLCAHKGATCYWCMPGRLTWNTANLALLSHFPAQPPRPTLTQDPFTGDICPINAAQSTANRREMGFRRAEGLGVAGRKFSINSLGPTC